MKKFVIMALITMMVAGAAFAQLADGISVNAWGRVMFTPLRVFGAEKAAGETPDEVVSWVNKGTYDLDTDTGKIVQDDDWQPEIKKNKTTATVGTGASWGGAQARVDFRINGGTDYVGFSVASNAESGNLGSHDNGYHIWVKPTGTDILKITAGAFVDETLRGKVGNLDGGFSNVLVGREVPEEDSIFQRFGASGGNESTWLKTPNAFMISSAPVEGAYIGILVPGARDPSWSDDIGGTTKAMDAYRFMHIGAGYNIDGIGHVRAQWIGGWFGKIDLEKVGDDYADQKYDVLPGSNPARIEAAFALTALDNLLVDLGAKFWLPISDKDGEKKESNGVHVGLGANFRADAFAIGAHIDADLGGYSRSDKDDKSSNGLESLRIGLVPTYDLDFATVGASLAMLVGTNGKDYDGEKIKGSDMRLGFGGFISKGLAGGSLKAGLAYSTATIKSGYEEPSGVSINGASGRGVFQIPVILEYAFF